MDRHDKARIFNLQQVAMQALRAYEDEAGEGEPVYPYWADDLLTMCKLYGGLVIHNELLSTRAKMLADQVAELDAKLSAQAKLFQEAK